MRTPSTPPPASSSSATDVDRALGPLAVAAAQASPSTGSPASSTTSGAWLGTDTGGAATASTSVTSPRVAYSGTASTPVATSSTAAGAAVAAIAAAAASTTSPATAMMTPPPASQPSRTYPEHRVGSGGHRRTKRARSAWTGARKTTSGGEVYEAPHVLGRWMPDEDERLREAVRKHGDRNWKMISHRYLHGKRSAQQCYHRWLRVRLHSAVLCALCGRTHSR